MNQPDQERGATNPPMESFTKRRKPAPLVIFVLLLHCFLLLVVFTSSCLSQRNQAALPATITAGSATLPAMNATITANAATITTLKATLTAGATPATVEACTTTAVRPTSVATATTTCLTMTPTH